MSEPGHQAAPDGFEVGKKESFRPDIQALRALAVGLVVLFHLWPNRLTGGYVGVDVFFAISGFLVTTHLLGEIERTGKLRPARFWARRVKRLQPAALLVLAVATVGVVGWVPRYLWHQFLQEIIGSALAVQNWVLAHEAVDYLSAHNPPSVVQHYWTLSAEEQFYFCLPLLLLAALGVARLLRQPARPVIFGTLVAVLAASLSYSIWFTATSPNAAYFSTFTRAWEFAGGAVLAMVSVRAHRKVRSVVAWLGVAAIGAAAVRFDAGTSFPGFAAALPVVGTLACIWAGRGSALEALGRFGPVAMIGRISYAIYLWHWLPLILLPYMTGRPLGTVDKLWAMAATVALAWASTRWVEDPIRFSGRLLGGGRRPITVGIWSAAAMATVVAAALIPMYDEAGATKRASSLKANLLATTPACLGAQSMDPRLAPCVNSELDGLMVPVLSAAQGDDDNERDCWGMADKNVAKVCSVGQEAGYTKRLYAIGDSHNNTLIGVYRQIAEANHWRIDVSGLGGCYLSRARQDHPSDGMERDCRAWRDSVIRQAHATDYDAFIATHSTNDHPVLPPSGQGREQATVAGLAAAWNELPPAPIVALRDNPAMPPGTLDCVAAHGLDATADCAPPRAASLLFDGQAEAAQLVPRAHFVDLSDYYCTPTVCPPVIGHVLVYRDGGHLTATYARTMAPYIEQQIRAALHA